MKTKKLVAINVIEDKIFIFRGQKVMIDRDLAELYEVPTYRLNEAVKRNFNRFPAEFMFKLNKAETNELIANCDRFRLLKHASSPPKVFTEYGVVMLSSVLKSAKAVAINIEIVKVFVRLKQYLIEHKDLAEQITQLKNYFIQYVKDNNSEVKKINEVIDVLIDRTKPAKIGFKTAVTSG